MQLPKIQWLAGVFAILSVSLASTQIQAQENTWRIAKVSGEAWIGGSGVQAASLTDNPVLRPGETVRTGRNGRVLLVRGAESILVSANSAISLPEAGRGGQTTIIQQAGSILLDVEKRNVPHFEVETPYLAAVVKGTRFRVSLQGGRANVDVVRGQVQVSDFRSGQFALVAPGQSASASYGAHLGLKLSGFGTFAPIQTGPVQAPRVAPIQVPSRGLGAPLGAVTLARSNEGLRSGVHTVPQSGAGQRINGPVSSGPKGAVRISAPIGEVRLDISKVTRGMARSDDPTSSRNSQKPTVWSTGELNPGTSSGKNVAVNSGSAAGTTEAYAGASATANAAATGRGNNAANSNNNGVGNGNGKTGNGLALDVGNGNGNGLALGVGNGNGNGLALGGGNGNGNGLALGGGNGNGNGLALGVGNGNR